MELALRTIETNNNKSIIELRNTTTKYKNHPARTQQKHPLKCTIVRSSTKSY